MTSFIIDLHNKCAYIYYKTEVAHYDRNSGSHISGMVAQACRTGGSLEHRLFIYEQQLDLCERHQQERELSILQLRDVRHNMKNNLVSILAYAENGDNEKIIGFVNEIMEEGGIKTSTVTNSGTFLWIDSASNLTKR